MAFSSAPVTADTTEITADSTVVTVDQSNTRTADDYVALITPWQSTKARFVATVRVNVQPYADAQAVISTLPMAYDLDYAEGVQLDAVGAWIGRSRIVPVPLPNTFFTIGDSSLGVGSGYIKGDFDSSEGISLLPDDLYRRLLYAKILANSWDGTAEGILAILRAYFTDPSIFIIVDDAAPSLTPVLYFSVGDAARGVGTGKVKGALSTSAPSIAYGMKIGFAGKIPSQIDLAVLSASLIPLKAMGVSLSTLVTTVDQAPLFGVGTDNPNVAGVGTGAIGASPSKVAALIAA
jgi:hypothetical protein